MAAGEFFIIRRSACGNCGGTGEDRAMRDGGCRRCAGSGVEETQVSLEDALQHYTFRDGAIRPRKPGKWTPEQAESMNKLAAELDAMRAELEKTL